MSTDLWPEGYDLIELDQVDSTNAEAARRASSLPRPTWITARHQTKARGRRGRAWQHPEGNLAATLVMRPGGQPAWAALRSFLAANALFETLAHYTDRGMLGLKWPNDVLLADRKVAGILLESAGAAGAVDWLAIGIGVNLAQTPILEGPRDFAPVSLAEVTGSAPAPRDVLALLANNFATEEAILDRLGFAPIRAKWLAHAARLGEVITARTERREITGQFDGIDAQGHLVLITATGPVTIPAADVFF